MPVAIKNAQSRSNATFDKLQSILARHKARQIGYDFDDNGRVSSLMFVIEVNGNTIPVKLPARVPNVAYILYRQRYDTLPATKQEQAYRTAWANIRDWVDAQLALVDTDMVKMEEVFLPYMIDAKGQTFFEVMQERGFAALPEGSRT